MPTCSHCGKAISCPDHVHGLGPGVVPCELKKGALWVQVVDDADAGVRGVDVTVDGVGTVKTDPQGLAAFDPLDEAEYAIEMSATLPGSVAKSHRPPSIRAAQASVSPGEIAFVKLALERRQPKIEVVDRYAFVDVVVGLALEHTLVIENGGDADLRLETLTFPKAHFLASPGNKLTNGTTVAPGDHVELKLQFEPSASGDLTGDLVIESNDPDANTTTVVLSGKAVPPWALAIEVASDERPKVGSVNAAWPEGEIEVGISANDADHTNPEKLVTHTLAQIHAGTFTLANVLTGTAKRTLYVWARAKSGAWFSRADVEVTLEPGDGKTAKVEMKALTAKVGLFRGTKALTVVPFSTTDKDGMLDAAIPDTDQGVAQDSRPSTLDAAFTFPLASELGDVAEANANPALFRVRVQLDATPEIQAPTEVEAVLKVVTSSGELVTDPAFCNGSMRSGTASHAAGMKVTLQATGDQQWDSPYCRVVTSWDSRDKDHVVVHSLTPVDKPTGYPVDPTSLPDCRAVMEAGKQFGRKLQIEGTIYGVPFHAEVTMGGRPYARVPVKLLLATSDGTDLTNKLKRIARIKIHQLNAWWAGQGLEFELVDPQTPLHTIVAPPRRLITIGEHSGPAKVSTVDFDLELEISLAATGKGARTETISIAGIAKDQTPAQVAAKIAEEIKAFEPAHPDNDGIELDATVHDLGTPRVFLQPVPFPRSAALPCLGTHGPADIVLSVASGGVDALEITGLAVVPGDVGIDIHAPPTARPYHEAIISPPAATTRQWIREFGGGTQNYVSVIVEGKGHDYYGPGEGYPKSLCEPGLSAVEAKDVHALIEASMVPARTSGTIDNAESKSRALTLLNFGRWSESCAAFTMFLALPVFQVSTDDLQHEMGHALSDLDHTIDDPAWFYKPELLHTGSANPAKEWKITRHEIHVGNVVDDSGTWTFTYEKLPDGYGGAVRKYIAAHRSGWEVDTGFNGWT
jgi:hypothetical protein